MKIKNGQVNPAKVKETMCNSPISQTATSTLLPLLLGLTDPRPVPESHLLKTWALLCSSIGQRILADDLPLHLHLLQGALPLGLQQILSTFIAVNIRIGWGIVKEER